MDLASVLPILADCTLVTCEDGPDLWEIAERSDIRIMSIEAKHRNRRRWRSTDLDLLVDLSAELLVNARVLPYASCAAFDQLRAGPCALYAVPASLKRTLDDKHVLRRLLERVDIPTPPHVPLQPGSARLTFDQVARAVGIPFVVQPRVGSAGAGTELVGDDETYRRYFSETTGAHLASRLVGSTTLNVHGVVAERSIDVSWPTVQLTGIAGFHTAWGGYCGSDATVVGELPADLVEGVRAVTARVGALLAELRYRGVYGVDIAVDTNTESIVVLEVNPRFQASTWLLDQECGSTSIAARHLAAYGAITAPSDPPIATDGAFLVINTPERLTLAEEITPGPYDWSPDGLRPAVGITGDATVLISGSPGKGTTVEQGASVIRVSCRGTILAADGGRALTSSGARLFAAASDLVRRHCV